MKNLIVLLFALVLIVQGSLVAQICAGEAHAELSINNIASTYHNGGDMFWDLISSPRFEVPKGSGKHSSFAAGMWMGGVASTGGLRVAAQTYRQAGNDFFPGPVSSTGDYTCEQFFNFGNPVIKGGLISSMTGKTVVLFADAYGIFDEMTGIFSPRIFITNKENLRGIELPDGRILVYGDNMGNFPNPSPSVTIDTVAFSNTIVTTLNYFHFESPSVLLPNGKVLIAGLAGTELFDPLTNTSTLAPDPIVKRAGAELIRLNNGKILLSGGSGAYGLPVGVSSTEIYDPTLNAWSPGPNMSVGRKYHELLEIPGGDVLVLGGNTSGSVVDRYNPATNTITVFGSLGDQPKKTTALMLANGKVLVSFQGFDFVKTGLFDLVSQQFSLIYDDMLGYNTAFLPSGSVLLEKVPGFFTLYNPVTDDLSFHEWQKIWKVKRTEIDAFILDFANNTVDFTNYPDIETWPAHGDVNRGEDFHLAPFVDVNHDGFYRPQADGDYPCIEGDEALWYIINDETEPHSETGGPSLQFQIETMVYAFDCSTGNCPDSVLDNVQFLHFEVVNKSGISYTDFQFGFWLDSDLGLYSDDYVGSDTNLALGFTYNGDINDEGASGYGLNPPAMGVAVLNSPGSNRINGFMTYENDFSIYGNPTTDADYYNYLSMRWLDGTPITNDGANGTGAGPQAGAMYPGDAGFCGGAATGWSEVSAGNQPFDRRMLIIMGPANVGIGDTLRYDVALIWARGYYNDNLGSVCELKDATTRVKSWWQTHNPACFNLVVSNNPAVHTSALDFTLFPNPVRGEVTLLLEAPLKETALVGLFDMQGRELNKWTLAAGILNQKLDMEGMPTGIYLLSVQVQGQVITRKVVVR